VSISDRLGAVGEAAFCRQRRVAAAFKPHQSRAFDASILPRRWLARDSFPAFGEAKRTSNLIVPFLLKQNTLALSEGGEGGIVPQAR